MENLFEVGDTVFIIEPTDKQKNITTVFGYMICPNTPTKKQLL